MLLSDNLEQDLKQAVKARDNQRALVLRSLKAALKNELIAKRQEMVDDQLFAQVVKREIKKRQEAAQLYEQGKRADLKAKEEQEINILQTYQPAQLGEEQVVAIITEIINQLPEPDRQFGTVMKQVMAKVQNQADGKVVAELVRQKISS